MRIRLIVHFECLSVLLTGVSLSYKIVQHKEVKLRQSIGVNLGSTRCNITKNFPKIFLSTNQRKVQICNIELTPKEVMG